MAENGRAVVADQPEDTGALQSRVLSAAHFERFLQALVEMASDAMGPEVFAGATVVRDGQPATVAVSAPDVAHLDEIQYAHDDGPCLTALRTNEIILVDNLETDDRFETFRRDALPTGTRSTLSLPLDGGESAVGALNVYADRAYAFGQRELVEGRRLAGEASRALALAVRLLRHPAQGQDGQPVPTRHTAIDQATGILMARNGCGAEEAFSLLRAATGERETPLREVAEEIVASVTEASGGDRSGAQG